MMSLYLIYIYRVKPPSFLTILLGTEIENEDSIQSQNFCSGRLVTESKLTRPDTPAIYKNFTIFLLSPLKSSEQWKKNSWTISICPGLNFTPLPTPPLPHLPPFHFPFINYTVHPFSHPELLFPLPYIVFLFNLSSLSYSKYFFSIPIFLLPIVHPHLTMLHRGRKRPLRMLVDSHCKENPIYEFPEKKLRSLSPNFHVHISVSDLHIPRIGPPMFLLENRQTDRGNI